MKNINGSHVRRRDAVFCFLCRQFDVSGMRENTFTDIGYDSSKNATTAERGFSQHVSSSVHIQSMASREEKIHFRSGKNVTVVEK